MKPHKVGDQVLIIAGAGTPVSRHNRQGQVIGIEPLTIQCVRRVVTVPAEHYEKVHRVPNFGGGAPVLKAEMSYR